MLDSVVINTYNRPESLDRCLAHLAPQRLETDTHRFEVIVIDDGGDAQLEETIARHKEAFPVTLEKIGHAGRSAARNRGVALARGERVLFLGDDVMVEPGCLARHFAMREDHVAVVGPYPWRGLRGSSAFRQWAEPTHHDQIADRENAGFLYFATGNLSMSRRIFEQVGGFDERFRVYGWEDLDLGLRIERAGGRLRYDAQARAIHDHPHFTRAALWRREYEMGMTAIQFWEKWCDAAPDAVAQMLFWDPAAPPAVGPAWRRALARSVVAVADAIAPESRMTRRLYERTIYAHRYAGVAGAPF